MPLLVMKGPREGQCNICGIFGPLTEDHTPPKSCVRPTSVQLRSIMARVAATPPIERGIISHNGVRYRSLCSKCNNEILGQKYDPPLASFVNGVSAYVSSMVQLPDIMSIKAEPQKIMRAVLGHLSAQGINGYQKGTATETCRDYFLDESLPLPNNIKIYYWLYPYRTQILIRDAAYMDLRIRDPIVVWLMKFFPLAFAVIWDKNNSYNWSLNELSLYRSYPIDWIVDLDVHLRPVVHPYWPEAPTDEHIMMFGQKAIIATEWSKPKKGSMGQV